MNIVSLVANETNTESSAGTEILQHGYVTFIIGIWLHLCFGLSLKKCTTCKLIKKSKTPETMDIKISLRNTARDRRVTSKGEMWMDFLLESSLHVELENMKQSRQKMMKNL